MRDGHLPLSCVGDLVNRPVIPSVAVHWLDIHILLVEAGYDLRQVVVVLLLINQVEPDRQLYSEHNKPISVRSSSELMLEVTGSTVSIRSRTFLDPALKVKL